MTDPMLAGYLTYQLTNGVMPKDIYFAHAIDRVQWMRGWDNARADAQAGKVTEPDAHLPDLYPFVTGEGE